MRQNDIDELLRRDPFLPFRIFLSDGNQFDVTQPHTVIAGKLQLFILLRDDRWKLIPLRHIASVETLQAA
jgi:hypothetical protein